MNDRLPDDLWRLVRGRLPLRYHSLELVSRGTRQWTRTIQLEALGLETVDDCGNGLLWGLAGAVAYYDSGYATRCGSVGRAVARATYCDNDDQLWDQPGRLARLIADGVDAMVSRLGESGDSDADAASQLRAAVQAMTADIDRAVEIERATDRFDYVESMPLVRAAYQRHLREPGLPVEVVARQALVLSRRREWQDAADDAAILRELVRYRPPDCGGGAPRLMRLFVETLPERLRRRVRAADRHGPVARWARLTARRRRDLAAPTHARLMRRPKAELVRLCEEQGLATDGTKDQLARRLGGGGGGGGAGPSLIETQPGHSSRPEQPLGQLAVAAGLDDKAEVDNQAGE